METIISILTRFVADAVWCCTDSPRVVDTFPNGNVMTLVLTREPGRATWITRRDYAFNGSSLYWYRTAYDAEGRPTETEDSLSATRQWLYNRRSELVGAIGTQAHPYDYAYSYDSVGNRLTSSDASGAIPYTSNELNQYTSLYLRGETLLYDADGNLTQDNSRDFAYSYDDENRLVSVTPANPVYVSRAIENVYDHRNRRIKKIVRYYDGSGMGWNVESTHVFVWDGWNIVLEQITFADNTTRTVEYFWGNDFSGTEQGAGGVGGLLATRIDGVFYVPVYGGNGNIMMYVAGNGWIAAQYDYDPYGNIRQSSGPLASQFAFDFSTKYHDRKVGLVAYQLRTYNPTHGRWFNRDPIEEAGGVNLYGFCGNFKFGFDEMGLIPAIRPVGPSPYVKNDCLWFAVFFEDINPGDDICLIKHLKQELYDCSTGHKILDESHIKGEEIAISRPNTRVLWARTLGGNAAYSSLMNRHVPGKKKCRRGKIVFSCDFFQGSSPLSLPSGGELLGGSWFRYRGDDSDGNHGGAINCYKGGFPRSYSRKGAFASVKVDVSYSCGKEDPSIVVHSNGEWRLFSCQRIDTPEMESRSRGEDSPFKQENGDPGQWISNGRVVDFEAVLDGRWL